MSFPTTGGLLSDPITHPVQSLLAPFSLFKPHWAPFLLAVWQPHRHLPPPVHALVAVALLPKFYFTLGFRDPF